MLLEIQCNKFARRIDGEFVTREKIVFHEGLNTILGDKKAENSIGKSTFLLIVDFCFGGDDYCNPKVCNVVTFVGHHTVQFAFKFGDRIEYYSRNTLKKDVVMLCDKNYQETGEEMQIPDFHVHLLKCYQIQTAESTFRGTVGRFFRIYGRKNYAEQEPLKYGDETMAGAVKALEQLFGVYNMIKSYEDYYEDRKQHWDIRRDGIKIGELAPIATSKKQIKNNQAEIDRLTAELDELTAKQDRDLSAQNMEHLDQAAKIKAQISALKRRRSRLVSQLVAIKTNLDGGLAPTSDDILELQEYFPEADIIKLGTIEEFHKKCRLFSQVK